MDETILRLSKSLGSFCNHLQNSSDALNQSVDRRPIPLDSASSTFIQCLNRRVSSASNDLNLLESMSFGTVSFEELLGHCNEVFKNNQTHLLHLQDHLKNYGYVPEVEIDDKEEDSSLSTPLGLDSKFKYSKDGLNPPSSYCEPVSAARSVIRSLEEDPLLDESLSLKNLGISEVSLATLASEAGGKIDDPGISLREPIKCYGDKVHDVKGLHQPAAKTLGAIEGKVTDNQKPVDAPGPVVKSSKDDYESLPSYMKSLLSWEDLLAAVEKINSNLSKKEKTKGYKYFHQDEVASLELGPKGKASLLLLVRMNQLLVETIDGVIFYRVL